MTIKIAVLNRMRAAWPGGDLIAIDATIEALRSHDVMAEYAPEGWDREWLRAHDLAHIFHINFGWSVYNADRAVDFGVPYVVTPVFYPAMDLGASAPQMRAILRDAEMVMPFSNRERDEITDVLDLATGDAAPMLPIPNGTDAMFYFENVHDGDGREGVIAVAAREGDKNTDAVARACYNLNVKFDLIHGRSREEVAAAYKRARVFVNASSSERMSLTTAEALCAGCRVIDTPWNRGGEWYGPDLVKGHDFTYLIANAIEAPDRMWSYDPNRRARAIPWDLVARQLAGVYGRVMRNVYRRPTYERR